MNDAKFTKAQKLLNDLSTVKEEVDNINGFATRIANDNFKVEITLSVDTGDSKNSEASDIVQKLIDAGALHPKFNSNKKLLTISVTTQEIHALSILGILLGEKMLRKKKLENTISSLMTME